MKYHAILIKFQVCWSTHVHSFLLVLDVPILSIDKTGENILLVDNIVKVILPYFRVDLNLFDVVKYIHNLSLTVNTRITFVVIILVIFLQTKQ